MLILIFADAHVSSNTAVFCSLSSRLYCPSIDVFMRMWTACKKSGDNQHLNTYYPVFFNHLWHWNWQFAISKYIKDICLCWATHIKESFCSVYSNHHEALWAARIESQLHNAVHVLHKQIFRQSFFTWPPFGSDPLEKTVYIIPAWESCPLILVQHSTLWSLRRWWDLPARAQHVHV